jgi:hypothetical protein
LNENILAIIGFPVAPATGAIVPALFFSKALFFRTWLNLRAAAERDKQPATSTLWKIVASLPVNGAAIVLVSVFDTGLMKSIGIFVAIMMIAHFRLNLWESRKEYFVRISHWRFELLNLISVVCSLTVSLGIFEYAKAFA